MPLHLHEQVLNLHVLSGDCVAVDIDLPPEVSTRKSETDWTEDEKRRYVQWELRRLSADAPPGLRDVHLNTSLRMALDDDSEAAEVEGEGPPFEVRMLIMRPKADAYYTPHGIKVRAVLDGDYPFSPPMLHLMQTVHHFFLDHDNGLPDTFYSMLADLVADGVDDVDVDNDTDTDVAPVSSASARESPGVYVPRFSLRATLKLLHFALASPLHPCEGCEAHFESYKQLHTQRAINITAYSQLRRCASLFDETGGFRREWLHPIFREAIEADDPTLALSAIIEEVAEAVFSFPMLSDEFCATLLNEIDGYAASGLPRSRPNSMNKYGLILNEIGMEPILDDLTQRYLLLVSRLCFPIEGGAIDRHHSFVVEYEQGHDLGLDMHTDNSEVTFNVCLGRDFTGAGLTFCGDMGDTHHRHFTYRHTHRVGHCVVHLGRRRHGADDIEDGRRANLIIWCHNLAYRASRTYHEQRQQRQYRTEASQPDVECLSYTHDRDFFAFRLPTPQHRKMVRRAWCPPAHAQYPGYASAVPGEKDADDDENTLDDLLTLRKVLRNITLDGGVVDLEPGDAAAEDGLDRVAAD